MSNLYWLAGERMAWLRPYFPKSHGKPRVDDRRVLGGIIFVNRNRSRWRDVPKDHGPHKTLYSRRKRWSEVGIFLRMMEGLAAEGADPKTVMIDATYLKAHPTASSLRIKRGSWAGGRPHQRGMNTKLHAVTDTNGRPLSFFMPAGQISDSRGCRSAGTRMSLSGKALPSSSLISLSATMGLMIESERADAADRKRNP